jgi:hypothetical protein
LHAGAVLQLYSDTHEVEALLGSFPQASRHARGFSEVGARLEQQSSEYGSLRRGTLDNQGTAGGDRHSGRVATSCLYRRCEVFIGRVFAGLRAQLGETFHACRIFDAKTRRRKGILEWTLWERTSRPSQGLYATFKPDST